MAFEITRQEILKQANDLLRLFRQTRDQKYKDEEIRLRRIVTELEAFTGGGGSGVTQILAGTNVTVSPAGGTGIVTVNATGGGGGGGDMYKSVYDTDNSGIVDKAEALTTIGRNSTGATLYEGTIVRILGSTGNRPNFVKAQANNDANSAQTFGVVMADMPNNTDGYVLVQGTLHDLDTRTGAGGATNPFTDVTLADGDLLYLHPTIAGYVTNIKPSAPQHLVYVGVVTRTSPTNGTIVYRVQNGYELYELHDVAPTPYINNGVLYRDTTNNLWKSATIATLLGGTPLLSVPTLAQVTTAGNTTTNAITVGGLVVDTDTLFVDSVNNRVGIGTTSPIKNLYVQGIDVTQIGVKSTTSSGVGGYIAYNDVGSSYEFGMWGSTRGGFGAIASNNAYLYGSVDLAITTTQNLKFGVGSGVAERMRIVGSTGNVLINTTTDFGAKLSVRGFVRVQGLGSTTATTSLEITNSAGLYSSLLVRDNGNIYTNGSITAASALAQGVFFNNTLVAAANNDVLVGLDIDTNITAGAFTGLRSYGLRIVGDNLAFQPSTTTKIPLIVTSNNNTRLIISSTATGASFNTGFSLTQGNTFRWSLASYGTNADFVFFNDVTNTNSLFITGNTNNVLINTTTDTGHKLRVNGTVSAVLTNATHTNAVYYNTTTGELTYGTAGGGGGGTPTLDQVTTAGNTTTNAITVGLLNSTALRAVVTITDTTAGVNNPSYFGSYDNFLQLAVNRNPSTGVFAQTGKASSQISLEGDVSASSIRFYTTTANNTVPSERLRIFGNGNIGINTTTDAGFKLDVNGTTRLQGLVNGFVSLDTTNKSLIVINEGTPTASRGLAVYQNNDGVQAAAAQFFKSRGSYASPTNVNSGDLVGIFTFVPRIGGTYPIDISLFGASMTSSTGVSQFFITGTTAGNYTPTLLIAHNGNVGIGPLGGTAITSLTLPTARLQVRGSGTTTGTTALRIENSSGTAGLIVNDAGNTLIGTTTDAGYKLDVNGTARVQGDFTVDTNTLFVDAANDRVGIGTTTFPTITGTLKLFVDGSGSGSNGRTFFAVRNTSSSSAANFSLINSAGKLLNAQISGPSYTTGEQAGFFTQGAIPLYFMTDGGVLSGGTSRILFYAGGYGVSPTMTITPGNTGNVLIGTTTDTGHKLRVNGTVSAALSNVTHTNQVYYNTATGELTYGALPTTVGYTGIVTIVTNPPGQQNLDFQNGLLVNVF
jgi:hypothetical protein